MFIFLIRVSEVSQFRQFYCMLVLSCTNGAMEIMENVADGERYELGGGCAGRSIFDCPDDVRECFWTS